MENLLVRGVAARRYVTNDLCAMPECAEKATDRHHAFPRSLIGNDSYFVIIDDGLTQTSEEKGGGYRQAIPHVTGLCRTHHTEVEEHRAWIKLEKDVDDWRDQFVWYVPITREEVEAKGYVYEQYGQSNSLWKPLGPLDPQPGDRKKARKPKPKSTESARKSQTWSIRVPKDSQEDGIEALKTLTEEAGKTLAPEMGWSDSPPPYFVLCAVLAHFIQCYGKTPQVKLSAGW